MPGLQHKVKKVGAERTALTNEAKAATPQIIIFHRRGERRDQPGFGIDDAETVRADHGDIVRAGQGGEPRLQPCTLGIVFRETGAQHHERPHTGGDTLHDHALDGGRRRADDCEVDRTIERSE